jgi:hypothetical protein
VKEEDATEPQMTEAAMHDQDQEREPAHETIIPNTEDSGYEKPKRFSPLSSLTHKRKVFLSIALILLLVLGFSVYQTLKNQQEAKDKALFTEIYNSAVKDYEEGEDLLSLNENVARDDFLTSQKTLRDGQSKFKEGSEERRQIDALLAKVEARLNGTGDTKTIEAKAVSEDESTLLKVQIDEDVSHTTKSGDAVLYATDDAVVRVINGRKTELFENDDDWSEVAGIGSFGSNVYLLDTDEGVLKFTPTGSGYAKTGYFAGEAPDLSQAVAMAIDGSVYILLKNGTISKYTRGRSDNFKVSGLTKPFANPQIIYTEEDFDNIYVLDRGNSRVVALSKDGEFVKEYQASILKNATGIEVSEADNKIFILAQNRVYELPME